MKLARTARFAHDFRSLPLQIQRRAAKQLQLLIDNPRHPSLPIKKMEGSQDTWEGRITKGYRFTFQVHKTRTSCGGSASTIFSPRPNR